MAAARSGTESPKSKSTKKSTSQSAIIDVVMVGGRCWRNPALTTATVGTRASSAAARIPVVEPTRNRSVHLPPIRTDQSGPHLIGFRLLIAAAQALPHSSQIWVALGYHPMIGWALFRLWWNRRNRTASGAAGDLGQIGAK